MPALIAVDAGTTGIRAFAIDGEGRPLGYSYRELTQHFPRPGWVEHDSSGPYLRGSGSELRKV